MVTQLPERPSGVAVLGRSHPNAERWNRAVDSAELRGALVCDILEQHRTLPGARVLDIGCGIGGSGAALLDRGARVWSVDLQLDRLKAAAARRPDLHPLTGDARQLPFRDGCMDIVVLQDMLEHVQEPAAVIGEAMRTLRPGGLMYLSTPNRCSPVNLVADPHFGLPFIAILRRHRLRTALRILRPHDADRGDLAQLLSYRELKALLSPHAVSLSHEVPTVLRVMFDRPEAVVWSSLHLRIVSLLRLFGVHRILRAVITRRSSFINRRVLPTWYLVARKESP